MYAWHVERHYNDMTLALVELMMALLYKYCAKIVQNNSPRWVETLGYYISQVKVEGNIIGTWSPVKEGSYFALFPN